MLKSYQNKVALVTGAGGGIGQALAVELANRGAKLAYFDVIDLAETDAAIDATGAERFCRKLDITDTKALQQFIDDTLAHFGHIDVLINNAGIALGDRTFEEVTPADMQKITDINYWGVVNTTQMLYHHLLSRPAAAIANISSSQGILGAPYLVPYCTTKFAVRGFTDALRAEHKIRGIRNVTVHAIHPGAVATNITLNADYHGANTDKFHKNLQRGTPPSDAAKIILDGILQNRGRIFISDGKYQDLLVRLLPEHYHHVVKFAMKAVGGTVR